MPRNPYASPKPYLPQGLHTGCKVQGTLTGSNTARHTYQATLTVSSGQLSIAGDYPSCDSIEEVEITSSTFSAAGVSHR